MCKDDRSVNYEWPSTYSGSCNNWNNSENALPTSSARGCALGRRRPRALKSPGHPACPARPSPLRLSPPSAPIQRVLRPPGRFNRRMSVWGGEKATSAHEHEQRHQLVHVHLSRSALERSCIPLHPTKPFIPVYTIALENSARAPALPGKFRF